MLPYSSYRYTYIHTGQLHGAYSAALVEYIPPAVVNKNLYHVWGFSVSQLGTLARALIGQRYRVSEDESVGVTVVFLLSGLQEKPCDAYRIPYSACDTIIPQCLLMSMEAIMTVLGLGALLLYM